MSYAPPLNRRACAVQTQLRVLRESRRSRRSTKTQITRPRAEIGGEYNESYKDVDAILLNYLTYKALRMTLQQLQETDTTPGKQEYTWLYTFAVNNPPSDNVSFLRALLQERQDFGERLIEQRLVVYQRWVKTFDKTRTNESIMAANKQMLLERLMGTVNMSIESTGSDYK